MEQGTKREKDGARERESEREQASSTVLEIITIASWSESSHKRSHISVSSHEPMRPAWTSKHALT